MIKLFKISVIFLSLALFQFSNAEAGCDFEIDVGKKFLKKHEKKFGPLIFNEKTKYAEFFLQASDVCNGIGFDNITVKYSFVNKKLLSILMFVENQPKQNKTTEKLVEKFDAVQLIKKAAEILGGKGGGGRKDFAQAGGVNKDKIDKAFEAISKKIN